MTHQAEETLTYNKEKYVMQNGGLELPYPLYPYLRVTGKAFIFDQSCSACHRGYIGEWEVRRGCLYLTGITGRLENREDLELKHLFPQSQKRVFASWFTGEIRCGVGEPKIVGSGMLKLEEYDKYLSFMFLSGRLISGKFLDHNGIPIGSIPITSRLRHDPLHI